MSVGYLDVSYHRPARPTIRFTISTSKERKAKKHQKIPQPDLKREPAGTETTRPGNGKTKSQRASEPAQPTNQATPKRTRFPNAPEDPPAVREKESGKRERGLAGRTRWLAVVQHIMQLRETRKVKKTRRRGMEGGRRGQRVCGQMGGEPNLGLQYMSQCLDASTWNRARAGSKSSCAL